MTPSEVLHGRLSDETDAAALIALVSDRLFPSKPDQDAALPLLTWWVVGGDGLGTLSGRSRLQAYDLRLEAHARTEAESVAVLAAARPVLHGWRDREIGVQGCFATEDTDQQTIDDGTEVSGQTFRLWYAPQP